MYAENFLEDMNCYSEEANKIVECVKRANESGRVEVTLPYLLKNTKISQFKFYDTLHLLLDYEILDMVEYSVCPQCQHFNYLNDGNKTRCSKCKNVYYPERIVEKIKLKR